MKKLLVPTDFSDNARGALEYAVGLARDLEAEITLLNVYYDPMLDSDLPTYGMTSFHRGKGNLVLTEIEVEVKHQIQELLNQVKEQSNAKIGLHTRIERGFPEQVIPQIALEGNYDMVIMGTRGKSRIFHTFFGSVTADVLQRCEVPVLAIPPETVYRSIEHVMYASAFDPADGLVVRQMLETLRPIDFDLYSIYIFSEHGHHYRKEDYMGLREAMQSHMKHVIPDARMEIVATGDRDLIAGIKAQLEDRDVDMLVMTTHARDFIGRLMHPSQTRKMLFESEVPLLVFRVKP